MRVCLCDERMASGSGRLTALLCGCADGLQAVCSLTRPSAPLTAKRTGEGEEGGVCVQVRRVREAMGHGGGERETGKECGNMDGKN